MRSLVALAVCTGALVGAACTNDYDALLEGASGGGSPTSTSDAASSTSDASSASASVSGSTTTNASTSSSTGGDGGNGGDGDGGDGGNGDGGDGGRGGAPPEVQPCEGFEADFDESGTPDGWADDSFSADLTYGGGTMRVQFDGDVDIAGGFIYRTADPEDVHDCAITTSVLEVEPIPDDSEAGGLLMLFDGPVDDEDAPLAGIAVGLSNPPEEPPDFFVGVLHRKKGSFDYIEGSLRDVDELPVRMRMRHADGTFYFEAELDDEWVELAALVEQDLEGTVDRVGVGAVLESEDPGDSSTVTVGPINAGGP